MAKIFFTKNIFFYVYIINIVLYNTFLGEYVSYDISKPDELV